MNLGKNVRHLREAKDWSREHLAELTGIKPRMIAYIETNESGFTVQNLIKLAKAFGVTETRLIHDEFWEGPDSRAIDEAIDRFEQAAADLKAFGCDWRLTMFPKIIQPPVSIQFAWFIPSEKGSDRGRDVRTYTIDNVHYGPKS